MKKIKVLTAIGNENLNNILKNQNEFEILENDIFYKEGILEFLEKNNNVDIFVMGDDWKGKFDFLKDYCEVVYLPRTEGISTSKIKQDLGLGKSEA